MFLVEAALEAAAELVRDRSPLVHQRLRPRMDRCPPSAPRLRSRRSRSHSHRGLEARCGLVAVAVRIVCAAGSLSAVRSAHSVQDAVRCADRLHAGCLVETALHGNRNIF